MYKRIAFILMLSFGAAACMKTELDQSVAPQANPGELVITAGWGDCEADTKTVVQKDGVSVWWMPSDQINLFFGTKYSGVFTSNNTEPTRLAQFVGRLTVATGVIESESGSSMFWAVYPFDQDNTFDGQRVTLTVPAGQVASEGTFANNMFPAIGRSGNPEISFYNVCGGACFSVATEGITKVVFEGAANENLAGRVQVGFNENELPRIDNVLDGRKKVTVYAPDGEFAVGKKYYAVLLPGELSGLSVTFVKGTKCAKTSLRHAVTVHRGIFGRLNGLDEGLAFDQDYEEAVTVPDPAFMRFLLDNYDADNDGEISLEEADSVTDIFAEEVYYSSTPVVRYPVCSFEGIGAFRNLTRFSYSLQSGMSSIDLSANTELVSVRIQNDENLEGLCISNLAKLETIECYRNPKLSTIEGLEDCAALKTVYINGGAPRDLDFSHNLILETLVLDQNQELGSVNVANCLELRHLSLDSPGLANLDVSQNANLERISLKSLATSITVAPGNVIRYLSFSGTGEEQGSLDLTPFPNLEELAVQDFTRLVFSGNSKLKSLFIGTTFCDYLDISSLSALELFNLSWSSTIPVLDISHNLNLHEFYAQGCEGLKLLYVGENQRINGVTVNRAEYNIHPGTIIASSGDQNWSGAITVTDPAFQSWLVANYDVDQNGEVSGLEAYMVRYMECSDGTCGAQSLLGIEQFQNLERLTWKNGQLSGEMDLSQNKKLKHLDVSCNHLSALHLTALENLEDLLCGQNDFSSVGLDVSANSKLRTLNCNSATINSLDLSHNPKLLELECRDNPIGPELVLSVNPMLEKLNVTDCPNLERICLETSQVISAGIEKDGHTVLQYADSESIPIPDPGFKAFLLDDFDRDHNGEISSSEARSITQIYVCSDEWNILSLQGIEYMPYLTELSCWGTWIDDLNLNQPYYYIGRYRWGELIGPVGTLLEVDVSHNPNLEVLNLDNNAGLCTRSRTIDLSHNPKLQTLSIKFTDWEYPDVSALTDLRVLNLSHLHGTPPDISRLSKLRELTLNWPQGSATSAFVLHAANHPELERLEIDSTGGVDDLSLLPKLRILGLGALGLKTIDLSALPPLEELYLANNQLTTIDLSPQPGLRRFGCDGCRLQTLDVSCLPNLAWLDCAPQTSLKTIYVTEGQTLPGVTIDRTVRQIPEQTQIVIK